jgi:hypothetical protein
VGEEGSEVVCSSSMATPVGAWPKRVRFYHGGRYPATLKSCIEREMEKDEGANMASPRPRDRGLSSAAVRQSGGASRVGARLQCHYA